MTQLDKQWTEAYKLAHVAADITEKRETKGEENVDWLVDTARQLLSRALAIRSHTKGERIEQVGP